MRELLGYVSGDGLVDAVEHDLPALHNNPLSIHQKIPVAQAFKHVYVPVNVSLVGLELFVKNSSRTSRSFKDRQFEYMWLQ